MQSEKSDLRKKFGLDYLTTSTKEQSKIESLLDKETERALVAIGGKILSILKEAPDKSAQLYDLVKATNIELETLFRVIERLESLELVQYAVRDKLGNHRVRLTQIGEMSPS